MTKDMTSGSPAKLIFGFAIPMFLGLLFQQFYSMVDTLIVGKFLGVRCSEQKKNTDFDGM